jgi:tryptophan synthase alpha subunit
MVAEACRHADAAVVGSALVQEIATHAGAPDLASRGESYVAWLKSDL